MEPKKKEVSNGIQATEISAGVLFAITDQYWDIPCFDNEDDFMFNVNVAYKSLTSRTLSGIQDGVKLFSQEVASLEQATQRCRIPGSEGVFAQWSADHSLDEMVEHNLKHKKKQLRLAYVKAKKHYLNGDYFRMGEDLTQIVELLTTPKKDKHETEWLNDSDDSDDSDSDEEEERHHRRHHDSDDC